MADWIYCCSDPPVGAYGTQSLLRTHGVVCGRIESDHIPHQEYKEKIVQIVD